MQTTLKQRQQMARYRKANPDKIREGARRWRELHPDEFKANVKRCRDKRTNHQVYGIYYNKSKQPVYIGSTDDMVDRKSNHKWYSKNTHRADTRLIHKWIAEQDWSLIEFRVLESDIIDKHTRRQREQVWINKFRNKGVLLEMNETDAFQYKKVGEL